MELELRLTLKTVLAALRFFKFGPPWSPTFSLAAFYLFSFLFFFKILFIFRERREGEREGEKHQCVVASHVLNPLSHASQGSFLFLKSPKQPWLVWLSGLGIVL